MKRIVLIILFLIKLFNAISQHEGHETNESSKSRFCVGTRTGVSGSYTDKAFLYSPTVALYFDVSLKKGYSIQLVPKYTWLVKWNEHYLTIPVHLKKELGNRFSVFAGPAMTWELGYFRDLGVSAGVS